MRPSVVCALVSLALCSGLPLEPQTTVGKKIVPMPGLVTGGDMDALLYYPEGVSKAPFLSFAHGMATGGSLVEHFYDDLLTKVAAAGFIILAPRSCTVAFCHDFWLDQLHVIQAAKAQGAKLDPVLANADLTRIGIFGHSMGGAATLESAANATANGILGAFALNPACGDGRPNCHSSDISVPVFFATSDEDVIVRSSRVNIEYDHDPEADKILVQLKDAGHMEATKKDNRWETWVVDYLLCHIAGDTAACDLVYDPEQGICTKVKASKCKVPNHTHVQND